VRPLPPGTTRRAAVAGSALTDRRDGFFGWHESASRCVAVLTEMSDRVGRLCRG